MYHTIKPRTLSKQVVLNAAQLPAHQYHTDRPCWWWIPVLPPDVEGLSIPDTVTMAPTSLQYTPGPAYNHGNGGEASLSIEAPGPAANHRLASTNHSHRHALLWAFSRSEPTAETSGRGGTDSNPRGGLTVDAEGATPRPSQSETLCQRENGAKKPHCPLPSPLKRLHTALVDGKEGLLRAARAICECGMRGGGGVGGDCGGREGPKLPLALLKIWGHESEAGEVRHLPSGDNDAGRCRGRRLRVVSCEFWCRGGVRRRANSNDLAPYRIEQITRNQVILLNNGATL